MAEKQSDAFSVGKDVVRYGVGKPEKQSRRSFLKTAAVTTGGALLVGGGTFKYLEYRASASNPDVWRNLVGQENPHPQYGHLIWSTMVSPKEGAKLRSRPAFYYHEEPQWPATTPIDRDSVIRRIGNEAMLIKNPLILADAPLAGNNQGVEVRPVVGQPYRINPDTIWFAFGVPLGDSPARVAFLHIDDVNFIALGADGVPQSLLQPPFESILQAAIAGNRPWEGTAQVGGVPLEVGLVSR